MGLLWGGGEQGVKVRETDPFLGTLMFNGEFPDRCLGTEPSISWALDGDPGGRVVGGERQTDTQTDI